MMETDYQDEITCPYCGHVDGDSWDFNLDEGTIDEIECGQCEREFDVTKHVSISYSSSRKKEVE